MRLTLRGGLVLERDFELCEGELLALAANGKSTTSGLDPSFPLKGAAAGLALGLRRAEWLTEVVKRRGLALGVRGECVVLLLGLPP